MSWKLFYLFFFLSTEEFLMTNVHIRLVHSLALFIFSYFFNTKILFLLSTSGDQVLALQSFYNTCWHGTWKSDAEFGVTASVKYLFLCYALLLPYNIGGRFSSELSTAVASIIVRYIFHYRYSFTRIIIISHLRPACWWCGSGIFVCLIIIHLSLPLLPSIRRCR